MEIDASNLISKLTNVKKELQLRVMVTLHNAAEEMAEEISSRNPTMWQPPMSAAGYGRYFDDEHSQGGLYNALDDLKNQITLSSQKGVISMGLGSETKLKSDFQYWDLFEGYGVYKRNRGTRAGGSNEYGFQPTERKNNIGKRGEGYAYETEDNPNPGVLPSFMFRDTFNAYKPIIKKRMIEEIIRAATNG